MVHHSAGGVCAHSDVASVGGDGENVGGPVECADGHPPAIIAETDILDLQRRGLIQGTERLKKSSITWSMRSL